MQATQSAPSAQPVDQPTVGQSRQVRISGVDLEVWESGKSDKARTVLLLHPGDGFDPAAPHVAALASQFRVIAPSHPGFGRSSRPKSISTVDDLSYLYLDFIEAQGLDQIVVLGLSFGGWIAAEIAVKSTARIAGLCLVDTLGAKFADPMTREIFDLFSVPHYEQARHLYHAPLLQQQTYAHLDDETATRMARNHESFALFGWAPTLHNPKLAGRLHRIKVPTHLIWGAQDRVVPTEYGRKWAQAIPGAAMEVIENAGHYPQVEQADHFVTAVSRFVNSLPARGGRIA
jgi:pimeloyl-ACP methyl ester carboxylesterase